MYHFFGMHDSTLFLTQVKFLPLYTTRHLYSKRTQVVEVRACGEKLAKLELQRNPQSFIYAKKIRDNTLLPIK